MSTGAKRVFQNKFENGKINKMHFSVHLVICRDADPTRMCNTVADALTIIVIIVLVYIGLFSSDAFLLFSEVCVWNCISFWESTTISPELTQDTVFSFIASE